MKIDIRIPGKPIAKKRPRFARHGKFVKTYSEQETEEGLTILEIRQQLKSYMTDRPKDCQNKPLFDGPVDVHFDFVFDRPKSHFRTGKRAGELKPSVIADHIVKPDFDNLIKFYCDALNHCGVWKDDCAVNCGSWIKRYAYPVESAHVRILIS